jgi:hypothetical protein
MTAFLRLVWAEVVGLFIDDGALAAACALLIAGLAVAVLVLQLPAIVAGILLLAGCLGILAWSVMQAARNG